MDVNSAMQGMGMEVDDVNEKGDGKKGVIVGSNVIQEQSREVG